MDSDRTLHAAAPGRSGLAGRVEEPRLRAVPKRKWLLGQEVGPWLGVGPHLGGGGLLGTGDLEGRCKVGGEG